MHIAIFIPSKDRACQLHLLLESYFKNIQIDAKVDIYVIYKSSDGQFHKAYHRLQQCYPQVNFEFETNWISQFKNLLNNLKYQYIWLLTDDSVFYRPITITNEILNLLTTEVNTFSFRYGLNTEIINYNKEDRALLKDYTEVLPNVLKWQWQEQDGQYKHPLGLDGDIVDRLHLLNIINNIKTTNINYWRTLDCLGSQFLRLNNSKPFTLCFKESVLINISVNQTGQGGYLTNGIFYPYSLDFLNKKYLSNNIIDLNCIIQSLIYSVQQEIEFKFKKHYLNKPLSKSYNIQYKYKPEDFPITVISYPRCGYHWLAMIIELITHKPCYYHAFFYPNTVPWGKYSHDINSDIFPYSNEGTFQTLNTEKVLFLYRHPVDTIISWLIFNKEKELYQVNNINIERLCQGYKLFLDVWYQIPHLYSRGVKSICYITYNHISNPLFIEYILHFLELEIKEDIATVINKVTKDYVTNILKVHNSRIVTFDNILQQKLKTQYTSVIWSYFQEEKPLFSIPKPISWEEMC